MQPRLAACNYGCNLCGATFGRAEHLNRHRLSHTNNKPFTCSICFKGFTRSDTLNRHLPIHSASKGRSGRDNPVSRTSQACRNCARQRLRCDGQPTCARCQVKGIDCGYSAQTRRRVAIIGETSLLDGSDAVSANAAAAVSVTDSTANITAAVDATGTMRDHSGTHSPERNPAGACSPVPLPVVDSALLQPFHEETQSGPPTMPLGSPGQHIIAETYAVQLPQQQHPQDKRNHTHEHPVSTSSDISTLSIGFPSSTEPSAGEVVASDGYVSNVPTTFVSTNHMSQGEMPPYSDFSIDWSWDENASLIDWMTMGAGPIEPFLSNLEQSSANAEFNNTRFDHPMPDYTEARQQPRSKRPFRPPDLGAAESNGASSASTSSTAQGGSSTAYQWPTDWNPVVVDNIVAFPDLSSASIDIVEAENFAHVGPLTQRSYEDMRQCLRQMDMDRTHYRPFRNGDLPPIDVMDCFLQLYFEYFHPIFPILHRATFESNKVPWQLTLGLCAIGARYSKFPSSSKCSNALQELLRRAIAITIENDNSIVRELWATQVMILNSIGMMYSGDKRFFEVAEAVRCSPAIQCRRNGSLKSTTSSVPVHSGSSGRSVETAWSQWINEESRRRLGFSAFLMDAQVVLYLDSNPCLLPSELEQQLPCSEDIWDAPTAEVWKEQYLKHSTTTVPTVHLAIQQLRQKRSSSPTIGDFARLVLVFVTYVEAAAIKKSCNSLLSTDTRAMDGVLDETNRAAVAVLETLRHETKRDGDLPLRSSLNCHIHLTLVLLFTPRTELVKYAHSFKTELSAVDACRRLHEWVNHDAGRHARYATAAAGALTGILQSNSTLGFYEPIAALLAILTMWTYSQMVEHSLDLYSFAGTGPERVMGGGRVSTVRLDNFREAQKVRDWVDGMEGVRAHIKDVGNIGRLSAGSRILATGREMVMGRSTWQLSNGLGVWLGKLRSRANGCDIRPD